MRLTLASRKSDLARIQAYQVGRTLQQAHPHLEIEYHFRASLGDQNQHDPLWKMPERGVFTEDFAADLIGGRFDLVVHSWKDLPLEGRPETAIVATLPRADQRDLLLVRKDRWLHVQARRQMTVLSSSPRREYNLTPFLKGALPHGLDDVRFENVRGNVPTRMTKLLQGEADALVLAKAALDRLLSAPEDEFAETQKLLRSHLEQVHWMVLPLSINPTAAAQGALAIEIRTDREDLRHLLQAINQPAVLRDVEIERKILGRYGGGCHQKIGISCLSRPYGSVLMQKGLSDQGFAFHEVSLTRPPRPATGEVIRYWPPSLAEVAFFEREVLSQIEQPHGDFWVARSEALPERWALSLDQVVWTAGVKSWLKLASRGVWVHGCSDSLGEQEEAGLEQLLGRPPQWVKLTHAKAPAVSDARLVATYRLIPKLDTRPPSGYTHYYWMSGTQFDRALELDPAILEAHHACGPGHTWDHLRHRLGSAAETRLQIYLSYDEWKKEMSRGHIG